MSFIGRLFSSTKTVEDTIASATRGLDSLVYTAQERDDRTAQAQEIYKQLWMSALPSALSRRLIACTFVFTYCLLILIGIGQYAFGFTDAGEFTFKVLGELLLQPVNIIVGFYFLTQIVNTYRKSAD